MSTRKKLSNKKKFESFLSRLIKKLQIGKPFTIQFCGEKGKVTEDDIILLNEEIKKTDDSHTGGFLPLLGMLPNLIGNIGKIFTGQGSDFPFDEEGNEKEGGILPALGALLPIALKALPLILGGAGAAASIAHTVNQKRHNNRIEEIAKGKGFYLDTHQGKSVRDFMKNAIDDAADVTDDVKKHLKSTIKNMKDGSFAEFKDGKLSFKFK